MPRTKNALIIGCGIAGPVTAMALKRVGVSSVIYEAYPQGADDAGLWLTLTANGIDALRTLGLHHLVVEAGFPTSRIILASHTGKQLGDIRLGEPLPDGTTTQTIKRADLYRALREEALRRGISIEYGKRLIDADSSPEGVVARFEDGSEAEGDFLVGCDGVHSRTRHLIDPAAPSPRYVGLVNLGASTRAPHLRMKPGRWRMVYGKRAFFGYAADAIGEVVWFANIPSSDEPSREELASISSREWKRRLIDMYADDRSPAAELVDGTDQELFGSNTYDLPTVPTWHRDSMIIIGDAAHATSPSSGQGASMAIEDAVELARCIRDLPETRQAFAAFEQLRRERVEEIVAHGARTSDNKAAGPVKRVVRDLMLPMLLKRFATPESLAWMYDHRIDFDAKVRYNGRIN